MVLARSDSALEIVHRLTETPFKLPEQTILFPGHHYSEETQSTIGQELKTNTYLRIDSVELWREMMGYGS